MDQNHRNKRSQNLQSFDRHRLRFSYGPFLRPGGARRPCLSRASLVAWVGLIAVFSNLSLGQVVQYHIQGKPYQEWLPGVLGTLLFMSAILSVLGYVVVGICYLLSEGQFFRNIPHSILMIGFVMLPLMIWEDYGSFLLSAAGSLGSYNISQIVGRTLSIGTIIILIAGRSLDVMTAISALLGGQFALCVILGWSLWKLAGRSMFIDLPTIKALLASAAKLHANTIASFILVQANIIMLNYYVTEAEVGWYQLSFQMIIMMLIIPQTASLVLYSKMAEEGPDNLWPRQKRLGLQVLFAMAVLSGIAYCISPDIITLLAGSSFEPSIKIFRMLLPALLGMTLALLLANQWIGRGVFITTTLITVATATVNIAINFYAIPKYGMMGAVWSMLIPFAIFSVVIQLYFGCYCEKRYRRSIQEN